MARKAREKSESGYYHIILKEINSQILFEDDKDREEFLSKLEYYQDIQNFEIHEYRVIQNVRM